MNFSKGGLDKDTGRKHTVVALTTVSLKDILGLSKGCSILRLKAKASITMQSKAEAITRIGAEFQKKNKSYFTLDFDSNKHYLDSEKKLLDKMKEYGIEDACVEKFFVKFKDRELGKRAKELGFDGFPLNKPNFIAHFFAVPFEAQKDRKAILETSTMKDKIKRLHWKIRKLQNVFLIDEYQTYTLPKSKQNPLIKWTISNKLDDSLTSDALTFKSIKTTIFSLCNN